MLFKPLGTSRLQRVQGAFVTEEEVALVVEHAAASASRRSTRHSSSCPRSSPTTSTPTTASFDPDEDPLLDRAIEVVVTAQTASVSLLQRRLRVGYTRAGRLIDMLERRGIISAYEGSKPRRVLVAEHELERRAYARVAALAAASAGAAPPGLASRLIKEPFTGGESEEIR